MKLYVIGTHTFISTMSKISPEDRKHRKSDGCRIFSLALQGVRDCEGKNLQSTRRRSSEKFRVEEPEDFWDIDKPITAKKISAFDSKAKSNSESASHIRRSYNSSEEKQRTISSSSSASESLPQQNKSSIICSPSESFNKRIPSPTYPYSKTMSSQRSSTSEMLPKQNISPIVCSPSESCNDIIPSPTYAYSKTMSSQRSSASEMLPKQNISSIVCSPSESCIDIIPSPTYSYSKTMSSLRSSSRSDTSALDTPVIDIMARTSKLKMRSSIGSVYIQSSQGQSPQYPSNGKKEEEESMCPIKAPISRREYEAQEKFDGSYLKGIEANSDEESWDIPPVCNPRGTWRLSEMTVSDTQHGRTSPKRKRSSSDSSDDDDMRRKILTPSSRAFVRSFDTIRAKKIDVKERSRSDSHLLNVKSCLGFSQSSKTPEHSQVVQSSADRTPYSPLTKQFDNRFRRNSQTFGYLPYYDADELQNLSTDVGFIDSHCHLDFLFKRADHIGSYSDYRKALKYYFPSSYEGCVAVFCDPSTFKQEHKWKPLIEEEGVWAAFGCHPHNAADYTVQIDEDLIQALKHYKVCALGEIGLDYSNRNNCDKKIQHKVFKRQLKIAVKKKLPLVIHCRESHLDGYKVMRDIVPDNHPIHMHCFTDSWSLAKMWLDAFPRLCIGITNVVTFPSAKSVHEVAKNIPLDRLLLETDAPYFLPRPLPRSLRWSHPGMAIHVAAQIAALRENTSINDVLIAVRANTKKIYDI